MPDDKKPDEGKSQTPPGEKEQSTPPASGDGSQLLSEQVVAILKRLDDVDKRISGVQKGTDKQIRHQVDNSMERILELAKAGKSKTEIEQALWIEQQMRGKEGADSEPAPDKGSKEGSPDLTQVIDEVLALPANDSRVTDLKTKFGKDKNVTTYLTEALKLAAALAAQGGATPAEQPSPTGKAPAQKVENPIENINDPKTLYKLAAQQISDGQQKGRGKG